MRPPENHAHTWFRVMLWLVPAVCALATVAVVEYFVFPVAIPAGIIVNLAFVIGAGWFSAELSPHVRAETDGVLYFIVKFFCLQLFIIPIFWTLVVGTIVAVSKLF